MQHVSLRDAADTRPFRNLQLSAIRVTAKDMLDDTEDHIQRKENADDVGRGRTWWVTSSRGTCRISTSRWMASRRSAAASKLEAVGDEPLAAAPFAGMGARDSSRTWTAAAMVSALSARHQATDGTLKPYVEQTCRDWQGARANW